MTARPSLEGIRARVEAATEGPWTHYYPDQCCRGRCVVAAGGFGFHNGDPGVAPAAAAEFIAHARTDVPALVAALDAVLEFAGANADEDLLDLIAQHLDLEDHQ